MSAHEEAKRLFALAERDLRSLGAVVDEADFAEETFGFLAQQCVEKALKSILSAKGVKYPLTHDLQRLYDAVPNADALVPFEDLTDLFPYAVLFRYSDAEEVEPFDRQALYDRLEVFLSVTRAEIGL